MSKRANYYVGLPWRVVIEPEQQDDGRTLYVASHPDLEGVLGTGLTPEEALADLRAARCALVEALLAEGYPVPEPALVTSAAE